jgi:hypothetical protein
MARKSRVNRAKEAIAEKLQQLIAEERQSANMFQCKQNVLNELLSDLDKLGDDDLELPEGKE